MASVLKTGLHGLGRRCIGGYVAPKRQHLRPIFLRNFPQSGLLYDRCFTINHRELFQFSLWDDLIERLKLFGTCLKDRRVRSAKVGLMTTAEPTLARRFWVRTVWAALRHCSFHTASCRTQASSTTKPLMVASHRHLRRPFSRSHPSPVTTGDPTCRLESLGNPSTGIPSLRPSTPARYPA